MWAEIARDRRDEKVKVLKRDYEAAEADTAEKPRAFIGGDYERVYQEQQRQKVAGLAEKKATIAELELLEGDELIDRFAPESQVKPLLDEDGRPVQWIDTLARGPSVTPRFVRAEETI